MISAAVVWDSSVSTFNSISSFYFISPSAKLVICSLCLYNNNNNSSSSGLSRFTLQHVNFWGETQSKGRGGDIPALRHSLYSADARGRVIESVKLFRLFPYAYCMIRLTILDNKTSLSILLGWQQQQQQTCVNSNLICVAKGKVSPNAPPLRMRVWYSRKGELLLLHRQKRNCTRWSCRACVLTCCVSAAAAVPLPRTVPESSRVESRWWSFISLSEHWIVPLQSRSSDLISRSLSSPSTPPMFVF